MKGYSNIEIVKDLNTIILKPCSLDGNTSPDLMAYREGCVWYAYRLSDGGQKHDAYTKRI